MSVSPPSHGPGSREQPELPAGLASGRPVFAPLPAVPTLPRRPGAVTAAAVIMFVGAALALLGGICSGLLASAADAAPRDAQMFVTLLAGGLLAIGVLDAVLAGFVLQQRPWARYAAITYLAVTVCGLLAGTLLAVLGQAEVGASAWVSVVWIVLHLVAIGLLLSPNSRAHSRAIRA